LAAAAHHRISVPTCGELEALRASARRRVSIVTHAIDLNIVRQHAMYRPAPGLEIFSAILVGITPPEA
jgi:hypothetical protein